MAQRRDASPFPGMDPYLEAEWQGNHALYAAELCRQLNRVLPDDLAATVETTTLTVGGAGDRRRSTPDVSVRQGPGGPGSRLAAGGQTLVREVEAPFVLSQPADRRKQRAVHVVEGGSRRLITAVELVSPDNKIGRGRRQYLGKRDRLLARGAAVVELDLTRRGPWRRLYDDWILPPGLASTYRAAVHLPERPDDVFVTPIPLRESLPTLTLPLRPGDARTAVDLQDALDELYAGGRYHLLIDYNRPPEPPLDGDDATWAAEQVRAAGLA